MAVEIDELLATIDETIAQVRGMIEGEEALITILSVKDKDDAENFLGSLRNTLGRFTNYREYVARNDPTVAPNPSMRKRRL